MFYSWISQWPVSNSKYRPTFQLQRDPMNWKMTPMNDFFHSWPFTTTTPTLPPHHQVAKGECGERHSWGDVATDTYVALTDLCCLLYFPFFLSCKHLRAFLFSLVCSRDWDLGEAGWYDNHQWHVLWPPVMCGGLGPSLATSLLWLCYHHWLSIISFFVITKSWERGTDIFAY